MALALVRRMRRGLAALLLAGCTYQAGSYRPPVGMAGYQPARGATRLAIGCVDLAVSQRVVDDAEGGLAVQYEFGNRCEQPQVIDLATVRVVGRTADQREIPLHAYDPDSELTPLELDGKSWGAEAVLYRDELGADVRQVCVDVASIVHADAARLVCIAAERHAVATAAGAEGGR